ncbi:MULTISPECIES: hypothetical protein [Saccharothrix]|uniref:hypothetical protein n=1 Tax=Saccharothrix TaxID=2071 RepID=UPI000938DDDE|nr:hypothetical protein [Saccharothrix sp. CB00851]OKI27131.1 hypothetical protein A6A25_07885 [Saccharothrix sp. CB00851]
MLRYMTVVGALCAGVAPFLSGGVPRPEADAVVIGLVVGVVLAAALAVGGGRARLHATADGSVAALRTFGAQPVPDGLLDTETGRVLSRPARPSNVRTEVGATPLLEEHEGGQVTDLLALDPATGATTRLSIEDCPRRTADVTTSTTYVRACADNGRELTVVTQPLDGSAPTSTPVRLDGSGSRARSDVRLVVAPGAIVITRTAFGGTPAPVVGLTG